MKFLLVLAGFLSVGCSHVEPYGVPEDLPATDVLGKIDSRVILIGDAGKPDPGGESILNVLSKFGQQSPKSSHIVFLGDNIYSYGLPLKDKNTWHKKETRQGAEKRLNPQLEAIRDSGLPGIFVPGNHDWDHSGPQGLMRVKEQQVYIAEFGKRSEAPMRMLPKDAGCPGPDVVRIGDKMALVFIDTQWFVHPDERGCETLTNQQAFDNIQAAIKETHEEGRQALVLGHYPLKSHGRHGGFFDWKTHIFPLRSLNKSLWIPLPIIGSLYPLSRSIRSVSITDISNPKNQAMIQGLKAAFRSEQGAVLFYGAGHDHNLQVLSGGDLDGAPFFLVSGAGAHRKTAEVTSGPDTLFAHAGPFGGFMVVDMHKNGYTTLRVIETIEGDESKCLAKDRELFGPHGGCVVYTLSVRP